ncbi:MAG: penicillin-binding protein [Saprospiraceae bacterium]|nr:penicillin-binding protein [Saprospiraceae bacterium]
MEPQHLITVKAALQEKRMPLYRKIMRWSWRLIIGGVAAMIILFLSINFTAIPSFRELEDPASAVASEVLANNGEVLGRFFIENRVPVAYEDMNPHLVSSLIATEDERFREHCGIDARAVARVMFRTILMADQSSGGGSTITQQLAKMLYSDRDFEGMNSFQKFGKLVYMKLREWITAVKLERAYTKEEIISMYLNQFNFINNAYGVHAASEVYFSKDQSKLKIQEAALLVGMLQNPSYFNPNRHPDRAVRRRWIVLSQMRRNEVITEAQYDSLKVLPLGINFKPVTFTDDKAPYLCDYLEKYVSKLLEQPESRRPDGSKYNLYRDGLRIYTTIDPAFQRHAEEAMQAQMKKSQARFFQVWKGRDPWKYKSGDATDEEIRGRLDALWSLIRRGDRFQNLWPKYMDEVAEKVQKRLAFELRDIDVERMLREEKKAGSIRLEVTPTQSVAYRKMMDSKEWPEIKAQYKGLRSAVQKLYDTPVKMKVFTWGNQKLEKDTVMTPMDSLRYHRMFLQTGMLAVDPTNSEIKAWVGGVNFKYFQYDHIMSQRQVGSTFKPFVYATAIAQQHISPCFEVYDQPVTIPGRFMNFQHVTDWTPKNSTGTYSGARLNLKEALKNSVNSVSAALMKQLGDTEPVRGLCNNMGIDSVRQPNGRYFIPPGSPSICLGAADLTVMQMTGAYSAFANNGMYGMPFVIKKVEDRNGRVLYRSILEEKAAIPAKPNWVMLEMLRYNVKGAPGVNTLKSDVGGKTGTTNDYTDAWFMGITPRLVVGTWVGGEDRWIRFLSLSDGQGARLARPIFADFINRLEKDPKSGYDFNARFVRPPGDLGIETNCAAYESTLGAPGDEEDFSPDIYNDELDETGKPKPKKSGESFGDEEN